MITQTAKKPLEDIAILTPPDLYKDLDNEFHFDFDPCPYPRPDNFDGLTCEWGKSNYVNPLFWTGGIRGRGITAWVRKALLESTKGKLSVMTLPLDGWVSLLPNHKNPDIRPRKDWYWLTPKGQKRKPSRPLIVWVIRPEPKEDKTI